MKWSVALLSFLCVSCQSHIPRYDDWTILYKVTGLPTGSTISYQVSSDGMFRIRIEEEALSQPGVSEGTLSPKQLEKFLHKLDKLKIVDWKEDYGSPSTIAKRQAGKRQHRMTVEDGTFWSLKFDFAERSVVSRGRNIGPDPNNPSQGMIHNYNSIADYSSDLLLEHMLRRLWASATRIKTPITTSRPSNSSLSNIDHIIHIAPEERSAMHLTNLYQDVVNRAFSREPGSLDEFLKASLSLDYRSAAGSAMHEFHTFPKIIGQWEDAELAKSCSSLNGAMKKKLFGRMDRLIPEWQVNYPQSHIALKVPQKHHRYR